MKRLELNLEKISFSQEGIEDFFWPVQINELILARNIIYDEWISLAQELKAQHSPIADIFNILFLHLSKEILAILQVSLLKQRSITAGYDELSTSRAYRLLKALEKKQLPALPPFIKKLYEGPDVPKWYRLPFRFIRDIVMGWRQHIPRRRYRGINFEKDIVTTIDDRPAQEWAKKSKTSVIYKRENFWFKPLVGTEIKPIDVPVDLLLARINKVFSDFEVVLPDIFKEYLKRLMEVSFSAVHAQMERVNKAHLPKQLWTATGGSLWVRMLSFLVRQSGGQVVRFDHAGGVCFFEDLVEMGPRELEHCDYYVTFSKQQSQNLKQYFPKEKLIHNHFPEIEYLSNYALDPKLEKRFFKEKTQLKTLMYVPTIYAAENVSLGTGMMSGMTLLDWQVRLLSMLKSWGYDTVLKPHPGGPEQGPYQKMQSICGNTLNRESFEKVIDSADVILLDMPASTTFSHSLISHKPIVFLNFNRQINTQFSALLQKRCAIVEGWFDEKNRAQVNWQDLKEAILMSINKKDRTVAQLYYNCEFNHAN